MSASATFRRTACLLLLGAPLLTLAEGDWRAERVGGEVLRDGQQALADGEPVASPARLQLAEGAALTLRRDASRLRLRGPAELRLHEEGPDGGARIVLSKGAMRTSAESGPALKINAGALRLQLDEAEAWVETADTGRVCALHGEIAVQHAEAYPTYRLQETGACLAAASDGVLLHEWPDRATLNARLARADGGSRPLPANFRPPLAPARPADAALPREPADAPTSDATTPVNEGGWYVVLGAFSTQERAQRQLDTAAVDGQVLPGTADAAPYRSVAGPHADREAAESAREALRERVPGAWLLQHTP
ncbi:SPOR domain-containing protein [Algiphilus aromaticivorans]|uniref:SPOR domain-containing protein n=1 Tax=Algiphilus aromaticivorans TaxID=382454 RepID=UPI0005C1AAE5|nr:SPOR domain-containing protein [Algiphilus aromaticivorans]